MARLTLGKHVKHIVVNSELWSCYFSPDGRLTLRTSKELRTKIEEWLKLFLMCNIERPSRPAIRARLRCTCGSSFNPKLSITTSIPESFGRWYFSSPCDNLFGKWQIHCVSDPLSPDHQAYRNKDFCDTLALLHEISSRTRDAEAWHQVAYPNCLGGDECPHRSVGPVETSSSSASSSSSPYRKKMSASVLSSSPYQGASSSSSTYRGTSSSSVAWPSSPEHRVVEPMRRQLTHISSSSSVDLSSSPMSTPLSHELLIVLMWKQNGQQLPSVAKVDGRDDTFELGQCRSLTEHCRIDKDSRIERFNRDTCEWIKISWDTLIPISRPRVLLLKSEDVHDIPKLDEYLTNWLNLKRSSLQVKQKSESENGKVDPGPIEVYHTEEERSRKVDPGPIELYDTEEERSRKKMTRTLIDVTSKGKRRREIIVVSDDSDDDAERRRYAKKAKLV